MISSTKLKVLVEEHQCPGCVLGGDTGCGSYKVVTFEEGAACGAHVAGTSVRPGWTFYLGMPKGFNQVGPLNKFVTDHGRGYYPIIFYPSDDKPTFDRRFYIPIWAMESVGKLGRLLFVRVLEPRISRSSIVVVEGGTLADAPGADDVSKFIEEIY